MKKSVNNTPGISELLHPSLQRILPPPEQQSFHQHSKEKCSLRYPPLSLRPCQRIKSFMSPATATDDHHEWSYEQSLDAQVCFKRYDTASPPVLHVRAVLVGRLTTTRDGALCVDDTSATAPIIIAPPPPPSLRDKFIYASNWRYIPRHGGTSGYFEVLFGDLVLLTSKSQPNGCATSSPANNPTPLVNLNARVTAKSCRIATRKQSCCFLVELSGNSHATTVVFRDHAVAWWPFLHVGSEINIAGLRLCSLPSYSRRTVFLASSPAVVVAEAESAPIDIPIVDEHLHSVKRPRVRELSSPQKVCEECPSKERTVDYEGLITQVLADGRFKLDERVTFHPGPIHSYGSSVTVFSNLRKGTKIKVFNAHLLKRCDYVRLFPTAKSSLEILYFGELKTLDNLNGVVSWRRSEWDRLWKQLDCNDVLWAEEMYDMLATKFWHWLRGSTQPQTEGTDRDRISCLLGDHNEVGLVQYVMHLLSGREELMNQDRSSRRDIYKEFLGAPSSRCSTPHATFANVPTLKQLKEMVLASQMSTENNNTEPSVNRVDPTSVQDDVVMLHHSQILITGKQSSKKEAKKAPRQERRALSGLLHALESECNRLAISDATTTLPVRIVGPLEPALIGSVVLVTDYYMAADFRAGEHESVTAVFAAASVKTIVDGPYAEMGNSAPSGPLICETQSFNRTRKHVRNRRRRNSGLSGGSIALTRRACIQSASGQDSQEASMRIADVPLICMFVEAVRCREDRMELGGKLVAVRSSQRDEAWAVILRDEAARIFWDCKLVLSGDAAMELSPVFQENRLWSVSCAELSGERDVKSYIWQKGSRDAQLVVLLSSTFNRIVPWVDDLGKGEYMRYLNDESLSNYCGTDNISEMSGEGKQYSLVRDAVESFSAVAMARVTSALWDMYNGCEGYDGDVVHIRGTVIRNSESENSNSREDRTDWVLTIRDDDLGMFAIPIDCRDRRGCLTGLAPGMRVLIHNMHRDRRVPWERCRFKAGADTIVRCVSIADFAAGCTCNNSIARSDYELMKRLPRLDLVDLEEAHGSKWVGVVRFDILEVLEIRLGTRRGCRNCSDRRTVEMGVTLLVEDGTTKGRLRSIGFEQCCELLGLSQRARETVINIALERGTTTIDVSSGQEVGLGEVFLKRLEWRSFTGVVVCAERVAGEEVVMKCFNLGFGSRVWTACREDIVNVECVALLGTGVAALRAQVCAIEDELPE